MQVSKPLQNSLQMFENKIESGYVGEWVLYILCCFIDEATLIANMTAWCLCTLTHFDRQFVLISGFLKNNVYTPVSYIKLQTSIMQL